MYKKGFTWILGGVLTGIVLIVVLQFISGRNINQLIQGNKELLEELEIQSDLQRIESEILSIESEVRGAVITQNPIYLRDIKKNIEELNSNLTSLKALLDAKGAKGGLQRLETLLKKKVEFNYQVLQTYNTEGKSAGETLIKTNNGKLIRDSIVQAINYLDSVRQTNLHILAASTEKNGRQARNWGMLLSIVACTFLIIVFLHITRQSSLREKIINRLNESEKKIKETAHLKEQFMANMSHEIRTPMNAIIGFTNLLKRSPLTEEQKQYVQNIHSAGENLLVLINDILDLSKIEAGMMHLEEVNFSLRSLISSVSAMFAERTKEKKLNYEVDIDSETPDILRGDAVRLTQILVNLLGNAVKFTEQGSITLQVNTLHVHKDKARLKITVADTGIGIPKEKQAVIFERFQQADSETTRRFGGTGLGLAIVKQLVDMQHGNVSLQSEPGAGTKFFVELEYAIPDEEEMYSQAMAAESLPVNLKEIKVLIAEDNIMNQQLIKHLMKSWNLDFTVVDNGEKVIEELKRAKYALVLMDIQMPVMDGYLTTEVIREEMKLDIPIIAMTAHAMLGEKERCLQLGMNDYISKPIKETVLFNMIAQYSQFNQEGKDDSPSDETQKNYSFKRVDLTYLKELSGNDEVFERAMMEQFVRQTPQELSQLQEAIESNDFLSVKKVAHSLKSTVGYIGLADELHPYADRIEKAATARNMDEVCNNFSYFKTVTQEAVDEVVHFLQLPV